MELIGMLDSPYVRRVAVSLQVLGLPFRHRSLSVFRTFGQFAAVNPVVKAPTLVCDDGTVLMDSTLILLYLERIAAPSRTLMPAATLLPDLRAIGLALAACDKAVQLVYERVIRPEDKRHGPWVQRQTGQMRTAFAALDAELPRVGATPLSQAGITAAVCWHFALQALPDLLNASDYPRLAAWSAQAEALPSFGAAPHGDSELGEVAA